MSKPVFKTTGRRGGDDFMVEYPAGQYIFHEGELGTEMYLVNEGQVEVLNRVGEDDCQIAVLDKGDFFGEMSLLEDLPRAASIRALSDVKLVLINGTTFERMLQTNPEIAVRMMRKLSRRLRDADAMLKEALASVGQSLQARELPRQDAPAPASTAPERLVHVPSGMEFPLSDGPETTLGRRDPVTGIDPDIDLTPVDSQRAVSRRHAKIYRQGSKVFLGEEIGTMNSTFLNGARLEKGVPSELKPGDEVRLGVVVLRFEIP
ncbi:MAG TPA: cyclic nucleotide-binding domain-containing protein [Thermoanaerobaculia bacterium]|nr:cyclic nucleotide-binding domain-containing protein [Thermoanaerobaculia bacterium]